MAYSVVENVLAFARKKSVQQFYQTHHLMSFGLFNADSLSGHAKSTGTAVTTKFWLEKLTA
jgi:hypothetical protein